MYGFVDCCVYSVIFVLFTKLFPLQVTGEMGGDVKTVSRAQNCTGEGKGCGVCQEIVRAGNEKL
ncbi:hypothetical protein [Bartonella taylorii]|uniref:hypothetical protein n=1 Tax=Bartonella taylorii TaxID=33046 RepID=UPI001ABB512A|nr:hypothetical protein [Bartonella taylorii]